MSLLQKDFYLDFNLPITCHESFQMLIGMLKASFVLINLRISSVWRWIRDTPLPSKVFLLPSPPMITSNSYSDTGWVLGWTNARQPIPVGKLQVNDNINGNDNKKTKTKQNSFILQHMISQETLQDRHLHWWQGYCWMVQLFQVNQRQKQFC